jgi:hypothetical protein
VGAHLSAAAREVSVEDLDHMTYERIAEVELKRSSQDPDRTVPRTGS